MGVRRLYLTGPSTVAPAILPERNILEREGGREGWRERERESVCVCVDSWNVAHMKLLQLKNAWLVQCSKSITMKENTFLRRYMHKTESTCFILFIQIPEAGTQTHNAHSSSHCSRTFTEFSPY